MGVFDLFLYFQKLQINPVSILQCSENEISELIYEYSN